MNTATKKLCLFSLTDSLGKIIMEQAKDDKLIWRGTKLQEAGEHALFKSKVKIDKSRLNQVSKKINEVYKDGDEVDVYGALLFLLCGFTDLCEHGANSVVLDVLIRRVMWVIDIWDTKLDKTEEYEKAMRKYERWCE